MSDIKVPRNWLIFETCKDIKGKFLYTLPVAGKRLVPSKLALQRIDDPFQYDTYRVISSKIVQEGLVTLVDTVVESYDIKDVGYDDGE